MEIILASKSPRRKKLLKELGIKFKVHESGCPEDKTRKSPAETALMHAKAKAENAAAHYKNAIVLGFDTIGAYKGRIMGKPKNKKEALEILRFLNGSRHKAITGIYIINTKTGEAKGGVSETFVTFSKMTEAEMNLYVDSGEGRDKAAGYAIQGLGAVFIEKIEGEYFNVVGLPICKLARMLKKMGVDLLKIREKNRQT